MIIDTSALIAVLDQEPEAQRIVRTLASAPERILSAANLVEAGIVMQARRGDDGARDLDLLLAKLRVDIVAVTADQADIARKAFRRYGRGRHAANLNFGDCCLRPGKISQPPLCSDRWWYCLPQLGRLLLRLPKLLVPKLPARSQPRVIR